VTNLEAANTLYDLQRDWLKKCSAGEGTLAIRSAASALQEPLKLLFQGMGEDAFFEAREAA